MTRIHSMAPRLLAGTVLLTTLVTMLATPRATVGQVSVDDALALPTLHPNQSRGRSATQSLDGDSFFAIDLFNGNLTLDIPLGLRYPIDDKLSYRFALRYNSNVWDFRDDAGTPKALPMAASNAGLGFDLSLGRLLAPGGLLNPTNRWLYITPDGAHHAFHSDLHWNTPDASDPNDAFQYSRDGSYLRLHHVSPSERRVAFPDGRVQTLALQGTFWLPTRIEHVGSNGWIDIAYATDGSSWTVSDSTGRQHTVRFSSDPNDPSRQLVAGIDLAAFGGTVATFGFGYASDTIARHCDDGRGGDETLAFLASLTDPLNQVRTFTHHGAGSSCAARGRLASADHAAGGSFAWSYGDYGFPSTSCGGAVPGFLLRNGGVVTRESRLPNDTVLGAWTLEPTAHTAEVKASPTACDWIRRTTTVVTPSSDRFVHHFSLAASATADGHPSDYGLPFTRAFTDATGAFLAHEVFDCTASGACQRLRATYQTWDGDRSCTHLQDGCFDQNRRLDARRTVYLDDPLDDGSERFEAVDYSDFDGLGQYRTAVETGNFVGNEHFETVSNFNPSAGSYPGSFVPPPTTAPWFTGTLAARSVRQGSAGTWRHVHYCSLTGGRIHRTRTLAGDVPAAHDLIEESLWLGGTMVERRSYGGDVQLVSTGTDLCTVTLPAPQYRTQLAWQAGVVALSEPLDAFGQPVPARQLDRDIDANTGLVAVQRDVAGLVTQFEYDALGRVVSSKPASGHGPWVRHVYRSATGGSSWKDGPRKTSLWQPNGGGATLRKEVEWRDALGRLAASEIDLPNRGGLDTRSRMRQEIDAEGRLVWRTPRFQPEDGNPAPTTYEDHDPLGRVRNVALPDGHVRTVAYRGDRWTQTTTSNGRAFTGGVCLEADGTDTTIKDIRGRAQSRVTDRPQPLPGLRVETTKIYDVADDVLHTTRTTTVGATTTTESRLNTRDRRGLITQSSVANDLGQVEVRHDFGEFDARRNPRWQRYVDASQPYPGLETARTYDAASRLVSIADASDLSRLWKTFTFGDDNGSGATTDARRGRLVAAERHNYVANGRHYTVRETFEYQGPAGRVSASTLDVQEFGTSLKRYHSAVAYDDLGMVATLDYPVCAVCSTGEAPLVRTVDQHRGHGFLVAVDGTIDGAAQSWVDDVYYAPSLQPEEVLHANGTRELFHPDPDRLPRVARLEVVGPGVAFDTGPHHYDGNGRICGAGSHSMVTTRVEIPSVRADLPCLDALISDPFGLSSGEIGTPSCRQGNDPVHLYDADDRLVASFDFSAQKQVYDPATDEHVWIQDPENWTQTWFLASPEGGAQRMVEDGYLGDWRWTQDVIPGLGAIGQSVHWANGSAPDISHLHTAPGIRTDPAGVLLPPGAP